MPAQCMRLLPHDLIMKFCASDTTQHLCAIMMAFCFLWIFFLRAFCMWKSFNLLFITHTHVHMHAHTDTNTKISLLGWCWFQLINLGWPFHLPSCSCQSVLRLLRYIYLQSNTRLYVQQTRFYTQLLCNCCTITFRSCKQKSNKCSWFIAFCA